MSTMPEGTRHRIRDGKIYEYNEGTEYYDVDWGWTTRGSGWFYLCEDTPENRKKHNIPLDR